MQKNLAIVFLIIVSFCLFYHSRMQLKNNALYKNNIEALSDSVHNYKNKYKAQAGYTKTLQGDKDQLVTMLSVQRSVNGALIAKLEEKGVVDATDISSQTKYVYVSRTDTILKDIKFTHRISDEWLDETIEVDSMKIKRDLTYRDRYIISHKLQPNGFLKGKTLTTYVDPMNPNTTVTGITSATTVVDKRKIKVGFFAGPALSVDPTGQVKTTASVGIGLIF